MQSRRERNTTSKDVADGINAVEKNKAGMEGRECGEGVSNVRGDLPDKVTVKQRPEGIKGANHANIWGRSVPSMRNNSKCKGPEA